MRIFSALYFLFSLLLYIIAIPFLLFLATKQKYRESIPARFFYYKNPPFQSNDIWFHACSLGEMRSLRPIIELIKNRDIGLSATTNTGIKEAHEHENRYNNVKECRFLPFEIFLPFWIKKPKILVVMEAELWFLLFFVAKRRGTKTILLNARISDRSYKSYMKFRRFYKMVFANIDMVFAQSRNDGERLLELGAKNVEILGNIKSLATPQTTKTYKKPQTTLITAASTHVSEELLVLEAFSKLPKNSAKLVIAPRHPERFELVYHEIVEFAQKMGYSYAKFSEEREFEKDIILIDSIGELINIYAISDVVILGGAFANVGGHNPLEPAHFGCKIISGLNIFNQFPLFELVENYKLVDTDNLADALMQHEELQKSYIKNSLSFDRIRQLFENNQGT